MMTRWLIGGWLVGVGILVLGRELGLLGSISLPVILALTMIMFGAGVIMSGLRDDDEDGRQ